ncbi:MAG: fumarylacetoacetate hydrolase family protein [Mycetocola sp.]
MRLISWDSSDGPRPAALTVDDLVVDLSSVADRVEDVLADDRTREAADQLVSAAESAGAPGGDGAPGPAVAVVGSLAETPLLAPVRPGRILCLGYNYRGHLPAGVTERDPDPEYPNVFVKTPNVLRGPRDAVTLPRASDNVDYEGEIAIVIGRRADAVSVEEAAAHIGGYTLFNDVSARDWQDRSSQWELGKCFDGFGPLGPWLVTADAVSDPHALTVEVIRDGDVTVSQSTTDLVFSMPFIVHYLSQVMVLEPGDVIATGSPQKLPDALASHRPLTDGDAVTIRVEGLGELTTRFIADTRREGATS